MQISVVICTHNPRREYLTRTLEHLRSQSLPLNEWELLIVDNSSSPAVNDWCDLSWHPHGRIIPEKALGLTNARLCGIRATQGDIIVFVDDDNLLRSDYLLNVVVIANSWPQLGAWGGSISAQYEGPTDTNLSDYYPYLAIREVVEDRWGNACAMEATPYGAGVAIRRPVADRYAEVVSGNASRTGLDRAGGSLISCGDVDMAWTSIDCGLGVGVFTQLSLTHIIPAGRMQRAYLLRMVEANKASHLLLDALRGRSLPRRNSHPLRRLLNALRRLRLTHTERAFELAAERGRASGWKMIDMINNAK